jgi:hypothetical protein
VIYSTIPKSSTPCGQKSLAEFVATVRSYPGPRGEVITTIRQLLEETDRPIGWADIARALLKRNPALIMPHARLLWSEFRKFQSAKSPGHFPGRKNYG